MSLASGIDSFMRGAAGSADLRAAESARTLAAEKAGYERDRMDMGRMYALANQGKYLMPNQVDLDVEALNRDLMAGRNAGKVNPVVEELAVLVANADTSVRNNKGFEFKAFSPGPDGTLTMVGSYDGQKGDKVATVGGGPSTEEEAGFAPTQQVAQMVANGFRQMLSKRANAGTYNEMIRKNKLGGTFDQQNESVANAVASTSQLIEDYLGTSDDPAYIAKLRQFKSLMGRSGSNPDKLSAILDFGAALNLPVAEAITPEVQEALDKTSSDAPATQTAPAQAAPAQAAPATQAAPAKDNSAEIARLEERLANVPIGRPGAARKKALKKQIAQLKAEGTSPASAKQAPLPEDGADDDPVVSNLAQRALDTTASEPGQIVKPTQEELDALQKSLIAQGVTSLAEASKATRKTQIGLLAALSTNATSDSQRAFFDKAYTNLVETGTLSFDARTLSSQVDAERKTDIQAGQLEVAKKGAARLQRDFNYKVGQNIYKFVGNQTKKIGDLFQDEKGQPRTPSVEEYYARAQGPDGALSTLFRRLMGAKKRRDSGNGAAGQEYNELKDTLLSQISFGLQFVSNDGDLEWSVFATDSDAPLTASDATLGRIARTGAAGGPGQPTGLKILKPGSQQQDGDAFSAEQVSEFFAGNNEMQNFFFTALDEIKSGGRR